MMNKTRFSIQKLNTPEVALQFPLATKSSEIIEPSSRFTRNSIILDRKHDSIFSQSPHHGMSTEFIWKKSKCKIVKRLCKTFLVIQDNSFWQIFTICTIVIGYLIDTFNYVFSDTYDVFQWNFCVCFCDLIYFIDLCLSIVIKFRKDVHIQITYLPRSVKILIYDTLTLFPYSLMYMNIKNDMNPRPVGICLRVIAFTRIYRIFLYFNRISNSVGVARWKNFFLQSFFYYLIFNHTFACVWYMFPKKLVCIEPYSSWIYSLCRTKLNLDHSFAPSNDFSWYTICLYFSLSMITNAGYGDIYPYSPFERIVAGLAMCVGFVLNAGFFVGTLTSHFVDNSRRKIKFVNQLSIVQKHLNRINIETEHREQILNYYQVLWTKKSGVQWPIGLDLLPIPLKMEMLYDVNLNVLRNSILFGDQSESVLRNVSLCMKHEFFLPGDIIYHQNVVKLKMIFVVSGVLECLSLDDSKSPVIFFGPGSCIAENALLMSFPARSTVRAATYTELQVLYRKDFFYIISIYPHVYSYIRKRINDRIQECRRFINNTSNKSNEDEKLQLNLFLSDIDDNVSEKNNSSHTSQDKPQSRKNSILKYSKLYNMIDHFSESKINLCLNKKFPWIMEANTSLTKAWDTFIFLVAIFVCITYPYYIGYVHGFPNWLKTLSVLIDCIYLIDIYVTLTTALYPSKNNIKLDRFLLIIHYRLRTIGFYFDIFSILYLEILFNEHAIDIFTDQFQFDYVLKLNRILKGWKIVAYFNKIEHQISCNLFLVRITKYLIYLTLISFWIGVILYMEACFVWPCRTRSWFARKIEEEIVTNTTKPYTIYPTTMSIYYAVTIASGVASGDILPADRKDLTLQSICALLGMLIFAYCIAEFSATFTYYTYLKTEFQENLYAIINFLKDHHVKKNLFDRVINYYRLQWSYNRGIYINRQRSFFDNVSENIQNTILIDERLHDISRAVPIFHGADLNFLQMITTCTKVIMVPPGEIITREGEIMHELYIIQQGFCEMFKENDSVSVLQPLEIFGLVTLLYDIPCSCTVRTITHCKLISLCRDEFHRTLSTFPEYKNKIDQMLNDERNKEMVRKIIEGIKTRKLFQIKSIQMLHANVNDSYIDVKMWTENNNENYNSPFSSTKIKRNFVRVLLLPYCILPNGVAIKVWMVFRIFIAAIYSLVIPYHITMRPFAGKYNYMFFILDLICIIDLYVMLHVGYYESMGQLVIHPLRTAKHYLSGMFFVDLVSSFPIDFIVGAKCSVFKYFQFIYDEDNGNLSVWKVNRILQIYYRLPQFFHFIEQDVLKKSDIVLVLKFLPLTLVTLNIWACALVSTDCQLFKRNQLHFQSNTDFVNWSKWYTNETIREQETVMFCKIDSWLDKSIFTNVTNTFYIYTIAFYWATSTIVSDGFGDIVPHEKIHILFCICMMAFGVFYFGYVYASISSCKTEINTVLSQYREMMTDLVAFMKFERVDVKLQKRVTLHLQYRWARAGGCEPQVILGKMNTCLFEDVVASIYETTLRKIPLFENIEHSFFRIISKYLREGYFLRGETVTRYNDILRRIYIIYRGEVKISTSNNEVQKILGKGALFGNLTENRYSLSEITVITTRNSIILFTSTNKFYRILKHYSLLEDKFKKELQVSRNYIVPTNNVDDVDSSATITENYGPNESNKNGFEKAQLSNTSRHVFRLLMPWKWFQFCLLPDLWIFQVTENIVFIVAYINTIIVSYQISFQDYSLISVSLAIFLDIVFFLQIIILLHRGFVDIHGETVLDPRKVRNMYLKQKKRIILDIVSNVPISYFGWLIFEEPGYAFVMLRLPTLLRIRYIFDFYNLRSNSLMVNQYYLKISVIIIWITILIHLFACVWFMLACSKMNCNPNSWIFNKVLLNDKNTSFTNKHRFYWYITSVYYVLNILTTTGLGDIYPMTITELVVTIVFMISTKFLIGIFIGDVTSVLNSNTSSLVNYEHCIGELRDYLQNIHVKDYKIKKMWEYVKRLWLRSRGQQIPRLLTFLPMTMQCDLMWALYGHHLRSSYIFSVANEDFQRQLSRQLKPFMFFPGNFIVQHGDTDQCMYFIHRGQVEILTKGSDFQNPLIYGILMQGDIFGVAQGLYRGFPHNFSYRARSTVHILSLYLDDWQYVLKFFPSVEKDIYDRADSIYLK